MGWTTNDLSRNRLTLEQAKAAHEADATKYSKGIKAELLASEWHPDTFYAVIRLEFPEDHERHEQPVTFLRVDKVEMSPSHFGYKDMTEDMGPYVDRRPSAAFAKAVYQHIPEASGPAADFRKRVGIPFNDPAQPKLAL